MITLRIDDQKIEVAEGTNLIEACLDNGIYIPNLCYLKGMQHPPTSCRLCFVEIEGRSQPVTSCTVKVKPGMQVITASLKTDNSAKSSSNNSNKRMGPPRPF